MADFGDFTDDAHDALELVAELAALTEQDVAAKLPRLIERAREIQGRHRSSVGE